MDFGNTGQGGLNLFDPEMAVEMSSLQTPLQTLPRMNVDWDGGFAELTNQPAGPPGGVYPAPTAMAYPHVGGDIGFGGFCAPGPGAFDALAGTIGGGGSSSSSNSSNNNNNIGVKPEGMLAIAHNSTRAARNGREQQRAQKISDVIDKLKGMLDKAKFTTGDASSKLHVLVSCESYIRNLQDRTRCHEMEAKLRSAASGNQYSADTSSSSSGSRRAGARGTRSSNDIEWTKKSDRARRSNASQRGETDGCTSSSGADGGSSSRSSSSISGGGSSSDGDCTKKVDAFFDEESSSTTSSSSAAEESRAFGRGVATRSTRRAAADSAGSASSSVEEDGDTGSSGDSSGGDTLAGTTTDSRGFTTDSSFSGDSGSADSGDTGSGDTGSADGGSDGSEEGAASARMRVVNYFDIFRLSNVPMAIADKEGALVDVNDAMRGFGRIDQDTVKTLTVNSLVAPESSKALEDAMREMLAASSVPQETPGPPQGGSQPFLANAGIGDRPTVLTVSLVYDERGEASAFHVALIPMAQKLEGKSSANCGRSSTEYNGEAPGLCVDEALRGNGGKDGTCAATCASATGKRSVRVWDSRERTTSQKRPAIKQQKSFPPKNTFQGVIGGGGGSSA